MHTITSIDLNVFDFMENVVLMLGWIVNDQIWSALNHSGIAALPFVVAIIGVWFEVRRDGEDEGNKGLLALNRLEASFYAMIIAYIFAVAPIMQVSFAPVSIDQQHLDQCGVRVASGGQSQNAGSALGGRTANLPVWWAMVHAVSTGLTNVALAALPCQTDYTYMRTQLNLTSIQDPTLRNQVSDFQNWCYGQARAKLLQNSSTVSAQQAQDTDWIGSTYFMNTPGYYDTFQANRPVQGFPWNQRRDQGHSTPPSLGGYPSCKQWWQASNVGLRSRLHAQISPSWWNTFHSWIPGSASADDYAIRDLVSTQHGNPLGNSGQAVSGGSNGNFFQRVLGDVTGFFGTAMGSVPAYGMSNVMSRALPMVQYLVLMALVMAMPFLIVISGYSFKVIGLLSFAYFGLVTMTFWFTLARWLQNHLVGMIYHSTATQLVWMSGISNAYDQGVMGLVQAALLIVLPTLWLAMLGWAGFSVGGGLGKAIGGGVGEAQAAGKRGGEGVQNKVI
ncbi:MAG: conjugal transfer protein TraG N-terminal domain-containing protein [Salinisphaera sp.]|jgi:hypothetical protein|nr:conjugal transfer protein TraG N-terminal domain-containing protein [Salinisphaera sp.]